MQKMSNILFMDSFYIKHVLPWELVNSAIELCSAKPNAAHKYGGLNSYPFRKLSMLRHMLSVELDNWVRPLKIGVRNPLSLD